MNKTPTTCHPTSYSNTRVVPCYSRPTPPGPRSQAYQAAHRAHSPHWPNCSSMSCNQYFPRNKMQQHVAHMNTASPPIPPNSCILCAMGAQGNCRQWCGTLNQLFTWTLQHVPAPTHWYQVVENTVSQRCGESRVAPSSDIAIGGLAVVQYAPPIAHGVLDHTLVQ